MRSDMLALPGREPLWPLTHVTQAMSDPSFELDTNEATAAIGAFDQARAAGKAFDPFTIALVDVLRRQLAGTDDGFEEDCGIDDGFEDDAEAEDDGEQYGIFCIGTRRNLTHGTMIYRKARRA